MSQAFPANRSPNSLQWAVVLAILLDIPILLILLLAWGGDYTTLLILVPFSGISLLIIYISYAASKMTYVLGDEELAVKFPISPLRVSYSRIANAGKVDTALTFRLFGGSVPGAHFGSFSTSNLGTVNAYSTKYKGDFVLLELSDGGKILLSPRDPDAFVSALKERIVIGVPSIAGTVEPRLDVRLAAVQLLIVTVPWLFFLAYFVSVYPGLPEIVPLHFTFGGVPNRYGSKVELIWIAVLATLFPTLNAVFALRFGKYNKGLTMFLSVVFLLAICLIWYVLNSIVQAA